MNKEQLIEYGKKQIDQMRAAVKIDDISFKQFLEVITLEQIAGEKGTLSLEKEKKPRAVDAFVYSGYRRAAVDLYGSAEFGFGLTIRLYHWITRGADTEEAPSDRALELLDVSSRTNNQRSKDYAAELNNDEAAILADLCGFISKMNTSTFPALREAHLINVPETLQKNRYIEVYRDIWSLISEGASSLIFINKATDENAQTIHNAIKKAAKRISKTEPPAENEPYFKYDYAEICQISPFEINSEKQETYNQIQTIRARRLRKVDIALDKVNGKIWNQLQKEIEGQITVEGVFNFDMAKSGSKQPAGVLFSINYPAENISISKSIDPFDELVCTAAAGLYNYVSPTFSTDQLYRAMGNSGTPGDYDRKKIEKSLSKQLTAKITITNEDEASKQKNREVFKYEGSLLPYERISAEINGKTVKDAIHLLREPPLIAFARSRKQITTYPHSAFEIPLNKTNANIALMYFILDCIAKIKSGTRERKILYTTLFKDCKITDKKQKERTKKEKIEPLLKDYKEKGIIKNFKLTADGIIIDVDPQKNKK